MQSRTLNAIILIAITALSTGATAQITYKCGDTYSQLPCPGGAAVDTGDPRTRAQKAQADLTTGRNARTADTMEKARLQQEKIDLAANTPPAKKETADTAANTGTTHAKKKKKAPDYFTAQVPGKSKKKHASKKSAEKKDESKS